jgi:hypothetical protein
MASSNNTTALAWSAVSSVALNSAAQVDADAIVFGVEDWDGAVTINANNGGTPASGDVVNVYAKWMVDGTTYDTTEHAEYLGQLDTYPTDTPGENPAQKTFHLSVSGKKGVKISCVAPQGASRAITISGAVNTHRPQ